MFHSVQSSLCHRPPLFRLRHTCRSVTKVPHWAGAAVLRRGLSSTPRHQGAAPHRLLINGELVEAEGGRTFPVINPATGGVFTRVPDASVQDAERAVLSADAAFQAWSRTPLEERAGALLALAGALEGRQVEFAEALTCDQGKPLAQARAEVSRVVALLRQIASMVKGPPFIPEAVPGNPDIQLQYVPRGVVVGIQPWNFPLAMAGKQLGPALAMGNTIVLKPSPYTPLTAVMLGDLAQTALPPGVVNILSGGNEVGQALVQHPRVRHVSFTGSIATGRHIMASCAGTLKKVTLELGGNDPAIILPGADIEHVAKEVLQGALLNSGQVCTAVKRLYVHESQYDDMVQQLAGLAAEAGSKLGDGMHEATSYGPINNEAQLERIESLVEAARAGGARVVAGGKRATPVEGTTGYFYEPTVVADVEDSEPLVTDEQFGPVLPVLKYADIEDAVQRANDTEFGLGGSVWGPDEQEASEVLGRLQVGIAWLNCHNAGNIHTPWGAVKQSGVGVGGDAATVALKEYAEAKTVWVRSPPSPMPKRGPAAMEGRVPELMQAVVWRGDPDPRKLRVETLTVPTPSEGEVLVKVRSCGVCRSDLMAIRGEFAYSGEGFVGFVPGHEISGTVAAVGLGVEGLELGTKVAGTFMAPCGKCYFCKKGEEDVCPDIKAEKPPLLDLDGNRISVSSFGGLAEYALLRHSGVFPLPTACEPFWDEAAVLGCAYVTAMGSVRHSTNLKAGDSVCIIGAGGVGGSLVQVAKAMGATPVVAVDISDEALEHAARLGADYTINSTRVDVRGRLGELTNGMYVDACFVSVGRPELAAMAVSCIRPGGRVCLVGIHPTAEISLPMIDVVRDGKKVIGNYGGRSSADMPALIDSVALRKIDLGSNVTQRFALRDAGEAFALMDEGRLQGRSIVIMEE